MSFVFLIQKTWCSARLNLYQIIGILRKGKILSGGKARVAGTINTDIVIKSMLITRPTVGGNKNELTFSIEKPSVDIKSLEGKELIAS